MSFGSYDELCKTIIDWSKSLDVGQIVDECIVLAEKDMLSPPSGAEPLNLASQDMISTIATVERKLSLPKGFQKMRRVRINDGLSEDLKFSAPNQLNIKPTSGRPTYYTLRGETIEFDRVPDSEYEIEISYFADFPPLTKENQNNRVLEKFPKLYLYGALYHAMNYREENERAQIYSQQFLAAIEAANRTDKRGRFSAGKGWTSPMRTP